MEEKEVGDGIIDEGINVKCIIAIILMIIGIIICLLSPLQEQKLIGFFNLISIFFGFFLFGLGFIFYCIHPPKYLKSKFGRFLAALPFIIVAILVLSGFIAHLIGE
ncbi:hypothetical protein AGMMS50249_1990 [candidate division SR1 bacterium]|nr:hypothetical protein AGMMS50249_1990 [candidate division SR1 bacterium]